MTPIENAFYFLFLWDFITYFSFNFGTHQWTLRQIYEKFPVQISVYKYLCMMWSIYCNVRFIILD